MIPASSQKASVSLYMLSLSFSLSLSHSLSLSLSLLTVELFMWLHWSCLVHQPWHCTSVVPYTTEKGSGAPPNIFLGAGVAFLDCGARLVFPSIPFPSFQHSVLLFWACFCIPLSSLKSTLPTITDTFIIPLLSSPLLCQDWMRCPTPPLLSSPK